MNKITKKKTSIDLVNDVLKKLNLEAEFDYELKSLLMLIIDASQRKGYISGYKDCKEGTNPKCELNMDIYKKAFEKLKNANKTKTS